MLWTLLVCLYFYSHPCHLYLHKSPGPQLLAQIRLYRNHRSSSSSNHSSTHTIHHIMGHGICFPLTAQSNPQSKGEGKTIPPWGELQPERHRKWKVTPLKDHQAQGEFFKACSEDHSLEVAARSVTYHLACAFPSSYLTFLSPQSHCPGTARPNIAFHHVSFVSGCAI